MGCKKVIIGTDCKSAIDIVVYQNDYQHRKQILDKVNDHLMTLLSMFGITVEIFWCPGHADCKYNEIADQAAKKISQDIIDRKIDAPDFITKENAIKMCKRINQEAWNRQWLMSDSGCFTRSMITKTGNNVIFPNDRSTAISYCRLLVGSTSLEDDLYKYGLAESPICECGKDRGTAEHFLLHCTLYEQQRLEMIKVVEEIWEMKPTMQVDLKMTVGTMLTPEFDARLSIKEVLEIKAALFEYLRSTNKKL